MTTRYLLLVVLRYNDDIKALYEDLVSELTKINFYIIFSEHRKGLQFQGKFFDNLVEMIDNIFLYLQATRQQLWQLHLVALDNFVPYFSALDLQKSRTICPLFICRRCTTWKWKIKNFCQLKASVWLRR